MIPIRRVDSNQSLIVSTFRKLGCSVVHLHQIGKGCPDILVGLQSANYGKLNILVEIKDGAKPQSKQKLTPDQVVFHNDWQGLIVIVNCVQDVENLVNSLLSK